MDNKKKREKELADPMSAIIIEYAMCTLEYARDFPARFLWEKLLDNIEYRDRYIAELKGDAHDDAAEKVREILTDDETRVFLKAVLTDAERIMKDAVEAGRQWARQKMRLEEVVTKKGDPIKP